MLITSSLSYRIVVFGHRAHLQGSTPRPLCPFRVSTLSWVLLLPAARVLTSESARRGLRAQQATMEHRGLPRVTGLRMADAGPGPRPHLPPVPALPPTCVNASEMLGLIFCPFRTAVATGSLMLWYLALLPFQGVQISLALSMSFPNPFAKPVVSTKFPSVFETEA